MRIIDKKVSMLSYLTFALRSKSSVASGICITKKNNYLIIKIEHRVVAQNFDEESVTNSDPFMHSQEIVKGKNESAHNLLNEEDKIADINVNTLVFTPSGEILGKPKNDDDNIAMLEKFSNTTQAFFLSNGKTTRSNQD